MLSEVVVLLEKKAGGELRSDYTLYRARAYAVRCSLGKWPSFLVFFLQSSRHVPLHPEC